MGSGQTRLHLDDGDKTLVGDLQGRSSSRCMGCYGREGGYFLSCFSDEEELHASPKPDFHASKHAMAIGKSKKQTNKKDGIERYWANPQFRHRPPPPDTKCSAQTCPLYGSMALGSAIPNVSSFQGLQLSLPCPH